MGMNARKRHETRPVDRAALRRQPIYSWVSLEECGVVCSCTRESKGRYPVPRRRERPKAVWRIRLGQTFAIFQALVMGRYEKAETEDLLKLDGEN